MIFIVAYRFAIAVSFYIHKHDKVTYNICRHSRWFVTDFSRSYLIPMLSMLLTYTTYTIIMKKELNRMPSCILFRY